MPDMTPIAQNIIPPNPQAGLDMYSKILGIQQQKAALQSAQAEASINTRIAQERQALAGVDWKQFQREDGSWDEDSITKTALGVAPTTGSEFAQNLNHMSRGSAETKAAWHNLNTQYQNDIRSIMASWGSDPDATPSELASQLTQYRESADKGSRKQLDSVIDHSLRVISGLDDQARFMTKGQPPEAMDQAALAAQKRGAINFSRAGLGEESLSGPGGLATPSTGTVNVGSAVLPITQSRTTGKMDVQPGGLRTTLPPGVTILQDANGKQYRYNTQSGQIEGAVGSPAPGGTVGAHGFTQPVPNQPALTQEIENTRKADSDYGVNRHINDQILRLSSSTSTGPGTEIWHHALGAIAGPTGGNNVSDYQTIGAYLDRQAALSARQMGLPDTNAGLATAASLSGTTGYQPKALQTKVKLTDALVEGAHQFRQGLDRVVGTGPNQDLSRYQAYRSAWAANFDPNVYLLENAERRGDKAERIAIINSLSPQQAKELQKKRRALADLASGNMP